METSTNQDPFLLSRSAFSAPGVATILPGGNFGVTLIYQPPRVFLRRARNTQGQEKCARAIAIVRRRAWQRRCRAVATTISGGCCYNRDVRILAASLVLAFVALCGAAACGLSDERQDLLACISPDGSKTALFYREFGGGAAGWQTEYVSVRPAKDEPTSVFEMRHGYDVVLEWVSADTLTIHYPHEAVVYSITNDAKLADSSRLKVLLLEKPSKWGSFVNDKTRCAGGSVGAIDSEPRPVR